jgi:tetratricopeptide (TPR) repeat protein/O-antigen ligase
MEGLWITAVILVPLVFLDQSYVVSEAKISYIEIPKVALLRFLAACISVLWLFEWAIKSRAFDDKFTGFRASNLAKRLRPSGLVSGLRDWLRVHQIRWFILAAALFFGWTFLTTILSGARSISIWGEIPGQDGYSAYTIASYGILFASITTHLRNQAQFDRLVGALVLMGALVGSYGVLQHYGHDFLGVTESTGGGFDRVTAFMGNTIFAAAVLSMTLPLTLMAATLSFHDERWSNRKPFSRLSRQTTNFIFTSAWATILSAQLLGLMFTFSRGSWVGALAAIVIFATLLALSFKWRILVRPGLVLGLGGVFAIAFLHSSGSVSVAPLGSWLGLALAFLGLSGVYTTLFIIERFSRAAVLLIVVGAVVAIVGLSVIGPPVLSRLGSNATLGSGPTDTPTADRIGARISSIKPNVVDRFLGGRETHWEVSWELIKNRPWFSFDDLGLSGLRPLIGYGPDLFRYTYLLESPPDLFGFLPLEPDHAHNYYIHQTVEQGIFGGLAAIFLFISAFGVAAHHLFRRRILGNPVYRLLLVGLVSVVFGRSLEMMVGVARISDLTILWVIFALFASLIRLDDSRQEEEDPPAVNLIVPDVSGQSRQPKESRADSERSFGTGMLIRLAVVACLISGIGGITWQKGVNSVRAAAAEARALEYYQRGDFTNTLLELDKAIDLAPDVPNYYNNRAQLFLAYQLQEENITEPVCNLQTEVPYSVCLGIQSVESNQESTSRQPFNYRAWIAAGNAAYNLQLYGLAVKYYTNASVIVPNSWVIRNELAESQIAAGLYEEALPQLEFSLGITGSTRESSEALFLKGQALKALGRFDDAMVVLQSGTSTPQSSMDLMRDIYAKQGVLTDVAYFDKAIEQDPTNKFAHYFRGLARLSTGDAEGAILDIDLSRRLGLSNIEARAARGYALFKAGDNLEARVGLEAALREDPQNPRANAYYGELLASRGELEQGLRYLELASLLNPNIGTAHLVRSEILFSLGLEEDAKKALDSSAGLDFPTPRHYIDRANIYASFDEFDLAFSDIDEAIRINPDQALSYGTRAKTHAKLNDFNSAVVDFKTAISLDPATIEYRVRLGLAEAHIDADSYDETLRASNQSFTMTVESGNSIEVLSLNAGMLRELGLFDQTVQALKNVILPKLNNSLDLSRNTYAEQGVLTDVAYFDKAIEQDPTNKFAHYFRGLARLSTGDAEGAILDIDLSHRLGLSNSVYRASRGYARFKADDNLGARIDLEASLREDPQNPWANAYYGEFLYGEFLASRGELEQGLRYLELASLLNPHIGAAHLVRSEILFSLGLEQSGKEALHSSTGLALPTSRRYAKRADLLASFGEFDLAFSDIDEAIRINPDQKAFYTERAESYTIIRNSESDPSKFVAPMP